MNGFTLQFYGDPGMCRMVSKDLKRWQKEARELIVHLSLSLEIREALFTSGTSNPSRVSQSHQTTRQCHKKVIY